MNAAWVVFAKELRDALRDRRTLLAVLLGAVAIGPLALVLLSALLAGVEQRSEGRQVVVAGLAHAPTLRNHFERQTWTVVAAPADWERALRERRLGDPVLVIGADFEAVLARGEAPLVEVFTSAGNPRAQAGAGRLVAQLQGFGQEQAALRLALRGVAPASLQALRIEQRDLASPAARAAQLTAMLPYFVLMAMLYGALNAALDTTAGERERGSLEPLLATPAPRAALVLGKWGAVAAVGLGVAVLGCASFLPGQWLVRSETLAALFRFGPAEALAFVALLAPLGGALSALLMAIAIRCRSYKEAQASTTLLVLAVSLLPLLAIFNQEGEADWHLWVPALAQVTLMGRVLRGEAVAAADVALVSAVCAVVAAAGIAAVARTLRRAALD